MTEITATAGDIPVHNPEDVRMFYTGTDNNPLAPDAVPKIGIEIEQTLFLPADLSTVKSKLAEAMVAQGGKDGTPVHHEPSATSLETITDPFTPDNLAGLIAQTETRFAYLHNLIRENGLSFSPFGNLPHVMPSDHEVVNKERYQTFFNPPRADMVEVFSFFANCMNIQTSLSYRDADHLLKIIRLAVALEPLIFLSTDSNAGFFEKKKADFSVPLHLNTKKGVNGGIPDFYYTARTGEELISAHIDFTLNNPHMFAYFGYDGRLKKLPAGWAAFNDLERRELGPRTLVNYRQAQSESWRRAANISTIDNADGQLVSHRAELAPFQTGLMHQRGTAILLSNLIAFNEDFQKKTAALLREFGIDVAALDEGKALLENNFKNAVYHGNRFAELPFGTGTLGDFARKMADIVEGCYGGSGFETYIQPIVHIWRTGRPDWLVYRERFPALDDALAYMRNFPRLVQDHPELLSMKACADTVKI